MGPTGLTPATGTPRRSLQHRVWFPRKTGVFTPTPPLASRWVIWTLGYGFPSMEMGGLLWLRRCLALGWAGLFTGSEA